MPSADDVHAGTPAPGRLPAYATSFVGREHQVADVLAELARPGLVTLAGPGGSGKTRLAVECAAQRSGAYEGRVWFVELAAVADPALVAATVARAAAIEQGEGLEALIAAVGEGEALVVLDNCEHLVASCASLASELLARCPRVSILATSREPLGLAAERVYRVPPLGLPAEGSPPEDSESVRLFAERASAAHPGFALTAANAAAVVSICRRLDGIPLAIELAAARVRVLSPGQIDARLEDRFALLRSSARDVGERQRTLHGLIAWSYDLLSEPERDVLARLAVFRGGFDIDAAETVATGASAERDDILDVVAQLVEKSLVTVEHGAHRARYGMLETIRGFAAARLEERGDAPDAARAHLDWCVALAREATERLLGPDQLEWVHRCQAEHDNFRAALAYARDEGYDESFVALAGALGRFWDIYGYAAEGRAWLSAALERADAVEPALRAAALTADGNLADVQLDHATARDRHAEALAIWREIGDERLVANSLSNLGNAVRALGDNERARALHLEGLEIRKRIDDRWGIASSLNNLGNIEWAMGDLPAARSLYERAVELVRELGNTWALQLGLGNLCEIARLQGDLEASLATNEESLSLARQLGDRRSEGHYLTQRATLMTGIGDLDAARAVFQEALDVSRELADVEGSIVCLGNLGDLERRAGDHRAATKHLEESLRLAHAAGSGRRTAGALAFLARLASDIGDDEGAVRMHRQALRLFATAGDATGIVGGLEGVALGIGRHDQGEVAVRLLAAADVLAETTGLAEQLSAGEREASLAASRTWLDERSYAAAWASGAAMAPEEAVALALGDGAESLEEVVASVVAGAAPARVVRSARVVRFPAPAAAHRPGPTAVPEEAANVLRREGEFWTVTWQGRTFRLKDLKGLGYLAHLLARPGAEVHVLELVGAARGADPGPRHAVPAELRAGGTGDAGPLLDERAKAEYRQRIAELTADIEEAESWSDPERAASARAELESLTAGLAAAVGLGGRDVKAASAAERARTTVTKAIRAAVGRIAAHDRDLGEHLKATVRTGVFCSYVPDPRLPVAWRT